MQICRQPLDVASWTPARFPRETGAYSADRHENGELNFTGQENGYLLLAQIDLNLALSRRPFELLPPPAT